MKLRTRLSLLMSLFILTTTIIIVSILFNGIYDRQIEDEIKLGFEDTQALANTINYINYSSLNGQSSTDENLEPQNVIYELIKGNNNGTKNFEMFDSSLLSGNVSESLMTKRVYRLNHINGYYSLEIYMPLKFYASDKVLRYHKDLTTMMVNRSYNIQIMWITFVILGIVLIPFSIVFSRYFTRDMNKLILKTVEIGKGKFDKRHLFKKNNEFKQLDEAFNQMVNQIEDTVGVLNQEVQKNKRLYSAITHEIKTPITAIIGYSDLLLNHELNEQMQAVSLNHIHDEGKRISDLTTKLVTLVNSGLSQSKDILSIQEIIRYSLQDNALKIDASGIDVSMNDDDFFIYGDDTLLKTAFINLLDNAVKAISDSGSIAVEINAVNSKVSFQDSGCGMTSDQVEKVFEPFVQLGNFPQGFGFGLTLVKEILNAHDTEIQIEILEQGTKFILDFSHAIVETIDEQGGVS